MCRWRDCVSRGGGVGAPAISVTYQEVALHVGCKPVMSKGRRQQSATGEFVLGKMVDVSSRESYPECRPVRPHLRRPLINGGVDRWYQRPKATFSTTAELRFCQGASGRYLVNRKDLELDDHEALRRHRTRMDQQAPLSSRSR